MQTTTDLVTLQLTPDQAINVHAALIKASDFSRQQQLKHLAIHESQAVGPVTQSEAWQAYRRWVQHENDTAQISDQLRAAANGIDLPFSAWQRFS